MGEALWWVLQQMAPLDEPRKLNLILTAGNPGTPANARKALEETHRLGFEIYGLGIKSRAISNLLPDTSRVIHDLNKLAPALFDLLQRSLFTHNHCQENPMSEETPQCPIYDSNEHVVLVRKAQKVGTAVGGATGAAAGYAGASSGATIGAAIGSAVPVVGTGIGALTGGVAGALAGFFTDAAVGNRFGAKIDRDIIREYRCNNCEYEFDG